MAVLNLNLLPAMNYRENVVKLAVGDVSQSAHALDVEKVAVLTQGIRIAKSALQAEQVKIFDLERKLAPAEDAVRHLKRRSSLMAGLPRTSAVRGSCCGSHTGGTSQGFQESKRQACGSQT